MTKKPKMELFPIAKVERYEYGKVNETYYVVTHPDGTEIECKTYEDAQEAQQEKRP